MKTKVMMIAALAFTVSSAFAAQTITGRDEAYGEYGFRCIDIVDHATIEKAELDADKKAAIFCDTFSMKPERVSEFTYGGNCISRGRGFAIHSVEYKEATAEYRCN